MKLHKLNHQADNEDIKLNELISQFTKLLKKKKKNLKLVPKNYYRNTWMALGIAVFGLPIGILMGVCWDSMVYLSIGLPIGLVIGLGLGAGMDNKALKEGRQLDMDIN